MTDTLIVTVDNADPLHGVTNLAIEIEESGAAGPDAEIKVEIQ